MENNPPEEHVFRPLVSSSNAVPHFHSKFHRFIRSPNAHFQTFACEIIRAWITGFPKNQRQSRQRKRWRKSHKRTKRIERWNRQTCSWCIPLLSPRFDIPVTFIQTDDKCEKKGNWQRTTTNGWSIAMRCELNLILEIDVIQMAVVAQMFYHRFVCCLFVMSLRVPFSFASRRCILQCIQFELIWNENFQNYSLFIWIIVTTECQTSRNLSERVHAFREA